MPGVDLGRDDDLRVTGELGTLVAAFDWATTPLGPIARWSVSLRTTVRMLLHSRHPMFLWWGDSLVQVYNDAYRPSLGVGKHPTALGQRGVECWPEIWPIIGPQIEAVMQRAQPSWHEDALVPIQRNGRIEEVYWTYGYSPVFDDDGTIGGTLVACTETTARVVAERRRRFLRDVGEQIGSITDPDALLTAAAEALVGDAADVPFAVLVEADGSIRSHHAAGLDEPTAQAIVTAVQLAVGAPITIAPVASRAWPEPVTEVVVERLAGTTAFAVLGLSPRLPFDDAYRDFIAQLVAQVDHARGRMTAWQTRAAVERERDNLLLQAPMATAVLSGPEHVFTLANPLYRKIVGREDLVGKTYRDAFPELVDTPLPGILDRVYRAGEPFVTNELMSRLDRGLGVLEDCYFKFNLEPMRDAAGQIHGMLAIAVDITELVAARRVLEQTDAERALLLDELQAASQAKDEFLALLGHELRNPLSPIVTAIELMKLGGSDHAAGLGLIDRQVQHMIRLVDDLLDVARITRGKLELARAPVELSIVLARALETASTLIEVGRHTLAVDVPARGLLVDADVTRLAQVFANLLTNAAKYTPPGGHIWVDARRDGDAVVACVRDDGVGIDPQMLEQVFALFAQVPQDLARSQGGLGLGLSIVKALTEQHGGTVAARSAGRGLGSELTVRLPLVVATAEVEHVAAVEPPAAPRRRILIVDDNEDAAWILGETLGHLGHDVRIAHDGPSALRVALDHAPEIALLDIGLPGMDGYELARRMRAEARIAGVQLIALTGYGQAGDRERSSDAGFAAHLTKPVAITRLVATIDGLRPA